MIRGKDGMIYDSNYYTVILKFDPREDQEKYKDYDVGTLIIDNPDITKRVLNDIEVSMLYGFVKDKTKRFTFRKDKDFDKVKYFVDRKMILELDKDLR